MKNDRINGENIIYKAIDWIMPIVAVLSILIIIAYCFRCMFIAPIPKDIPPLTAPIGVLAFLINQGLFGWRTRIRNKYINTLRKSNETHKDR